MRTLKDVYEFWKYISKKDMSIYPGKLYPIPNRRYYADINGSALTIFKYNVANPIIEIDFNISSNIVIVTPFADGRQLTSCEIKLYLQYDYDTIRNKFATLITDSNLCNRVLMAMRACIFDTKNIMMSNKKILMRGNRDVFLLINHTSADDLAIDRLSGVPVTITKNYTTGDVDFYNPFTRKLLMETPEPPEIDEYLQGSNRYISMHVDGMYLLFLEITDELLSELTGAVQLKHQYFLKKKKYGKH